ncbi:B-cell receptor-associated protein 31-like [Sesbania bispinosa]|nr:B-cell receptor-associated protein 31-like [Sesbania bispinosa]
MRAVEAAKKQSRSFEGSKSGSAEERKALMEEIATLRSQVKELESECEVKGSGATAL